MSRTVAFNVTCLATYKSSLDLPDNIKTREEIVSYIREHLPDANIQELEFLSDLDEPSESVIEDDIINVYGEDE